LLWDTTTVPPAIFTQPDQDWKIVGAGNFQHWTNGTVDLLLRHETLGINALWAINGTNFQGGVFLADNVYDTNWRIASQDVADSTWALQGDNRPRLTATVSTSPLGITLTYTNFQTILSGLTMTVQRKLTTQTNWTTIASNVGPPFTYADTNVISGTNYDYQVFNQGFGITYEKTAIASGINVPPVENRGKIILLVDNALTTQFPTQMNAALSELTSDLVGDGWTVIQTNVARHDDATWSNNTNNIVSIRSYVSNTFKLDTVNTRGVFIIGHVPIPYSGTNAPDGHTDHQGAWPADGYYGDTDGTWTDTKSYSNGSFQANSNAVGDGKFDQDDFPSSLELFVGRVDFANLPLFGTAISPTTNEANLVKQYFDKAHKYRFGLAPYPLPMRAAAYGYFFGNPQAPDNYRTFAIAMRNCSAFFGPASTNVIVADAYLQRPNADPQSYLWGFDGGFGNADAMNRSTTIAHTSADLTNPSLEPSIGFYVLDGSYFGDWNMTNDFMRATLASPNYGLAALWTEGERNAHWRLHGMALGEPIGFALLRTVNNPDTAANDKDRTLAILGDPTLRLHTLTSPASFVGHPGSGCVNFSWTAVSGVQYHLYKGTIANGPFTLLSANPIQNSTSDCPYPGSYYMLRALQLVTSGTGNYTNISQGAFWH